MEKKFRFRDKDDSLLDDCGLMMNRDGEVQCHYSYDSDSGWRDVDCTVEQWTGLKDKNGVDIYENDFLEYSNFWDNDRYIGKVEWQPCLYDNGGWMGWGIDEYAIDMLEDLKIVENPQKV